MKKIFTIAAALLITASVWAQAPEKMKYQAVVRDANNVLVTSTAVGMQISILQTTATGTAVYVETHTPTSNANGLVSLEIGTGTVVSGAFTTIDWANGTYFIKTETDPTGGTTYTISGTSQLMSVPYALHAKTAENVANDMVDDANADPNNEIQIISRTGTTVTLSNGGGTFTDSVGVVYTAGTGIDITNNQISTTESTYTIGLNAALGGYVFYVTPDGKHGLVAETQDQSTSTNWYTAQDIISDPANHSTNGQNFTDWRLPTKYELNQMYLQKVAIGGFASNYFWSSTMYGLSTAWGHNFGSGLQNNPNMGNAFHVRAVRDF
jgi:hypothetical protein